MPFEHFSQFWKVLCHKHTNILESWDFSAVGVEGAAESFGAEGEAVTGWDTGVAAGVKRSFEISIPTKQLFILKTQLKIKIFYWQERALLTSACWQMHKTRFENVENVLKNFFLCYEKLHAQSIQKNKKIYLLSLQGIFLRSELSECSVYNSHCALNLCLCSNLQETLIENKILQKS